MAAVDERLTNDLASLIDTGRCEEAWERLLALTRRATHYSDIVPLCRARKRLLDRQPSTRSQEPIRVAVLGTATTSLLEEPLALELAALGFHCELHAAVYNAAAWEMLDGSSPAGEFAPHVAVVVNSTANVMCWPNVGDTAEHVRELAEHVCDTWLTMCGRLHERTRCDIVLDNLHLLPTRPLGNLTARLPWEPNAFIRRINTLLGERAPAFVHISDVETLAAQHGVRCWFDPRYWYHARQPVSFDCLLPYVRNLARIIAALRGRTAKCLVLDLDNTLWGGVVADDGVDAIEIGAGTPVGEAHLDFQRYVLSLKRRGVLLAVCSKNDETVALRPFMERPEMLLKREDFVAFMANWRPKAENLCEIARTLEIGVDALVFVDDNPAEREQIRRALPRVGVVELSADPADFAQLLDDMGAFEVTAVTNEDTERVSQYQANAGRAAVKQSLGDYEDYLDDLEQRAVIQPFEQRYVNRIAQLINKTNQFNLTTQRMTTSAVEETMRDPRMLTAYVRLTDRFGDNGLISVLIARLLTGEAYIEQWLMSCRVLNRGVETLLLNYLVSALRRLQIQTLRGVYRPTPRNGIVRHHYQSLGFTLTRACGDETEWALALDAFVLRDVRIALVDGY